MKKIVHIITGLEHGGAEQILFNLCSLNPDQVIAVISLRDGGIYGDKLEALGIKVINLNFSGLVNAPLRLLHLVLILAKINPHTVQTWMYHADFFGGIAAWLTRVPNIVWNVRHSKLQKSSLPLLTYLIARLNALLSFFVPHTIVYCAHFAAKVHEEYGYCPKKSRVIQNGYSGEKFYKNNTVRLKGHQNLCIRPNDFVIGMAARWDPHKDYRTLIEAVAVISKDHSIKCILAGDGISDENKQLMELISQNKVKNEVKLLGPQDDMCSFFNLLDVHVLSSNSEGFPNVICEAMLCEVPCISTRVGDAEAIISDTGYITKIGKPQEIAELVHSLNNEKKLCGNVWLARKKSCRLRILNNFTIEKMRDKYYSIWDSSNEN